MHPPVFLRFPVAEKRPIVFSRFGQAQSGGLFFFKP